MQALVSGGWQVSRRSALLLPGALALALDGCGTDTARDAAGEAAAGARTPVNLVMLASPSVLGMVPFLGRTKDAGLMGDYATALLSDYGKVADALREGTADVALVQPGVAAQLYQELNREVCLASVNALRSLCVVSRYRALKRFSDLAGRTIYVTETSSSADYLLRHLLELAGIADEVTIELLDSPSVLAAQLSADGSAAGVMEEPSISSAQLEDDRIRRVCDLCDVWDELVGDGSKPVDSVTVVRRPFARVHPELIEELLAMQAWSTDEMTVDPVTYAEQAVELGLLASEDLAEPVVGHAHLMCETGEAVRELTEGYLTMLYEASPVAVGGSMPGDEFYKLP